MISLTSWFEMDQGVLAVLPISKITFKQKKSLTQSVRLSFNKVDDDYHSF